MIINDHNSSLLEKNFYILLDQFKYTPLVEIKVQRVKYY